MIHHLVTSAPTKAIIVADDTNIFVLLLRFMFTGDIKSHICSQETKNHQNMSQILLHLTRVILRSCRTSLQYMVCLDVTQLLFLLCFGIVKETVINKLNKKNIDLGSIGFLHEPFDNYLKQGINFLLQFYGQSKVETPNDDGKRCRNIVLQRVNQALSHQLTNHFFRT